MTTEPIIETPALNFPNRPRNQTWRTILAQKAARDASAAGTDPEKGLTHQPSTKSMTTSTLCDPILSNLESSRVISTYLDKKYCIPSPSPIEPNYQGGSRWIKPDKAG